MRNLGQIDGKERANEEKDMKSQVEIAQTFNRIRKERGMSLREASRSSGISFSTLSRFAINLGKADTDTLIRVCRWCDVLLDSPVIDKSGNTLSGIRKAIYADTKLSDRSKTALNRLMIAAYRHSMTDQLEG